VQRSSKNDEPIVPRPKQAQLDSLQLECAQKRSPIFQPSHRTLVSAEVTTKTASAIFPEPSSKLRAPRPLRARMIIRRRIVSPRPSRVGL